MFVQFVTPEPSHRRTSVQVSSDEDVNQRFPTQLRVVVCLIEEAGDHSCAVLPVTGVRNVATREQSKEMGLARSVSANHRHTLAEPDLQIEWERQVSQFELLADDDTFPGPPALEPHVDLLLANLCGRWPLLVELTETRLRRSGPARIRVAHRGTPFLLTHVTHESFALARPTFLLFAHETHPVLPGFGPRAEGATVSPRALAFDGDNLVGTGREKLPVMAHEEHRLRRGPNPFGHTIGENFRWPILAPDLAEFWRRWHISLSGWAFRNVFFPVIATTRNRSAALVITLLTIAMWHDLALTWVTWGLYHGIGMAVLAWWPWNLVKEGRLRTVGGVVLTNLYVAGGFAFVSVRDYSLAWTIFYEFVTAPVQVLL